MIYIVKKFISAILALILFAFIPLSVYADNAPVIVISSPTAIIGEETEVSVDIQNNPGIMAITVSITYQSNMLEYKGFSKGILTDYTVVDHPDRNLIRFVCVENSDMKKDGVLLTLKFKVKPEAKAGLTRIDIDYSSGDFCNWNEEIIMPQIKSGGVYIAEEKAEQTNSVSRDNDFEDFWTVDKPATNTQQGEMSRHSKNGNEVTDVINFDLSDVEENKIPNKQGETILPNTFTENNLSKNQSQDKKEEKKNSYLKPILIVTSIITVLIVLFSIVILKRRRENIND